MNLASILIKKVLLDSDVDTWGALYRHYLPKEYHRVHNIIQKHVDLYNVLPSFEDLKLSTREAKLREQIYSIETSDDVDISGSQLLDYVKNEYAQAESMNLIEKFLENSIATSTAEEIVESIQGMVLHLESKIDLLDPEEDMQRISLFESEELLSKNVALGLNKSYDDFVKFAPGDYVMFGGRRGSGKSLTCANIVENAYSRGKSSLYFTIEMTSRSILQRIAAIASRVPANSIRYRNMTLQEWERVAFWWCSRFEGGEEDYANYLEHRDFNELHTNLTMKPLRDTQIDVIHDPSMSLSKIRTELDKKVEILKPEVVVVDYINQVERHGRSAKVGQYDWSEQIEISKALKNMAQVYGVVMVSPYQMDATGEARFAKGLLDAPDAAFTIHPHSHEDNIIEFKCTKMRNGEELGFISTMDWDTLKMGPEDGHIPGEEEGTGEEVNEL